MAQEKQSETGATAVFIIRIWREWSLTESRWIGHIEQLHSDVALTFRDLSQLVAFLQAAGWANNKKALSPKQKNGED